MYSQCEYYGLVIPVSWPQAQLKSLKAPCDVKCKYLGQRRTENVEEYLVDPYKWERVTGRDKKYQYDVFFEWLLPWGSRVCQVVRVDAAIQRGVPLAQLSACFLLYSLRKAAAAATVHIGQPIAEQSGGRLRCEYFCRPVTMRAQPLKPANAWKWT